MYRGRFVFALALLASVAAAATQVPKLALFINGKLASGSVVVIKGRPYVPVSDVAKALGMRISKSRDRISLTGGSGQASSGGTGSVKGTLTYYFNRNYGNKPDVGAQVWLVAREKWPSRWLELPEDQVVFGLGETISVRPVDTSHGTKIDVAAQMYTAADGSGNFSFRDVPAGRYVLIMQSKHVEGARDGKTTQRDIGGRFWVDFIEVKAGRTTDCSQDFGMSAY